MPDAVILQFRKPVTIDLEINTDTVAEQIFWLKDDLAQAVLFPAELWPSEPAVSSQCGRSCSPDDCDAPRCYQR
jgi:hypothetical protein